ncbi:MAG: hypothetical protein DRG83_13610 [Deltaproteobacteria bacterium]|nr:MAG: hypothetical protein DRG83_13610 [Deltaproteobacteria bacterium]
MCAKGLGNQISQARFTQIVYHELIHAESICGWWKLGCKNCMIEEKRAYFKSGMCATDRQCTLDAWGSCKASWSCSDLFDNWKNYLGVGWPPKP